MNSYSSAARKIVEKIWELFEVTVLFKNSSFEVYLPCDILFISNKMAAMEGVLDKSHAKLRLNRSWIGLWHATMMIGMLMQILQWIMEPSTWEKKSKPVQLVTKYSWIFKKKFIYHS